MFSYLINLFSPRFLTVVLTQLLTLFLSVPGQVQSVPKHKVKEKKKQKADATTKALWQACNRSLFSLATFLSVLVSSIGKVITSVDSILTQFSLPQRGPDFTWSTPSAEFSPLVTECVVALTESLFLARKVQSVLRPVNKFVLPVLTKPLDDILDPSTGSTPRRFR